MTVSIIVAITANNAIGRKGDMLYHIREDLQHFRAITTGHAVVMGRKTFDSLPKGALPDRRNMVITRNPAFAAPSVETYASLAQALDACRCANAEGEVMVMGGGEIYRQAMPLAQRIYLTEINAVADDADTFFPEIDPAEWQCVDSGEWRTDPKTELQFRFSTWERR